MKAKFRISRPEYDKLINNNDGKEAYLRCNRDWKLYGVRLHGEEKDIELIKSLVKGE